MNNQQIVICTFYKFFSNPEYQEIRIPIREYAQSIGVRGIIVMAEEGLNATISGVQESIDKLFQHLKDKYGFEFSNIKISYLDRHPFGKIKVKAKQEIVTLKVPGVRGDSPGIYVKPEDWDSFISRPDVVLIDTRNNYEIVLGTFENAVSPQTEEFNQFPEWFEKHQDEFKDKKIAMCCTGGIRCEKSTSYLKSLGLKEVYHLEGGILKYLEEVGENTKTWKGDCFVFDRRIALDKEIKQVKATSCL